MRAAVFAELDQPLSVEDVSVVDPGPGEVLVRVTASGVCHSDLSVIHGVIPGGTQILGHEGAGVIEKVGPDVQGLAVGDRVIGSFVPACGKCWYCLRGESFSCAETYNVMFVPHYTRSNGEEIGGMTGLGTFAEMMVCSQFSVVKVETDLPDEVLALIGCGVTTGVGAALNTAHVEPGSTVAVIGCGGVGQAVIQGARIAGAARIIAIDPVALKRDAALTYGATHVIDPTEVDPVMGVIELTGGRGADYAFEVIGTAGTIRQAVETARPGGAAVLVGVPKLTDDVPIPAFSILAGKRLLGCIYGQANVRRDFPRFISLVEAGRLDVGSMVSRTMHLHEVNEALDAMQRGEVIRSVLVD
jgi:S-(hydroxymethyl)glutathione dehydrogenase / alcohol dehydrogenase